MKIILSLSLLVLSVCFIYWANGYSWKFLWRASPLLALMETEYERTPGGPTGVEQMHAAVTTYMKECCNSREAAAQILVDSDFKVWVVDSVDPVRLKQSILQTGVEHDGYAIHATRKPTIRRFWYLLTVYRVSVYFKDDEIVNVIPMLDTTWF